MVREVVDKFSIDGKFLKIEKNNTGNINNTYVLSFLNDDGTISKYLLQKINKKVYKDPVKLMENINLVTRHIEKKLIKMGDFEHQALRVIKTKDGNNLLKMISGEDIEYYRVFNYIEDAISYDYSSDSLIVYNTGKAFGNFQRLLIDFPLERLHTTIPHFHDTKYRYDKFLEDIKVDKKGRVKDVLEEINFLKSRENLYGLIDSELKSGELPLRVTHNDTKVNNVMMNKYSKDYMTVIDLDTVMPGSLLYDYADGIRSAASTSSEDETDLNKIGLDMELFKSYTKGFLSEMGRFMSDREISLMGCSIRIIALELAIRFIDDYINGDTYFKIKYDRHNLDRAKNQIQLVKDIETKLELMNAFINGIKMKEKKAYI